jgi:hypothetical protein
VLFNPNCRSGARAIAITMVAQLGLVTIRPFQPRAAPCASSSARCSALTSGIISGTVGSIR